MNEEFSFKDVKNYEFLERFEISLKTYLQIRYEYENIICTYKIFLIYFKY